MKSIWINDREYFFYTKIENKYILVSNPNDIYNDDILEIEILDNKLIRMRLRRFEKKVIQFVSYINEEETGYEFKYYSKKKTNFYAGEFEQKDLYYVSYFQKKQQEEIKNSLKLKRDGSRPFKFKETNQRYVFVDNDGDEFKITSGQIGTAKLICDFVVPSIPRIKKYIIELETELEEKLKEKDTENNDIQKEESKGKRLRLK